MMGLIIVMGLCTGVAVMVGQNLGAGKVERAVKAVKYAAAINAAFMLGVAALYLIFATEFLKFFGATGESLADGTLFMQIVPLSYFLMAIAMTMGFAMNGAGYDASGDVLSHCRSADRAGGPCSILCIQRIFDPVHLVCSCLRNFRDVLFRSVFLHTRRLEEEEEAEDRQRRNACSKLKKTIGSCKIQHGPMNFFLLTIFS